MEQRLHKSLRLAATLLVALSASTVWGYSFPIDLTFAGRGEATKVDKVTVTNLSQPGLAPVTLNGTDILRLVDPNDPDAIESTEELQVISEPILTPNPSFGDGTLIFDAKSDGPVRVSVYTTGGMLLDAATLNVSKGRNTARIPAQATGIYIVNIDGQGVKSSTRWICSGSKSFSGIALGGAAQWADVTLPTKTVAKAPQKRANTSNVVILDYFDGDILRLTRTATTIQSFAPAKCFGCWRTCARSHSLAYCRPATQLSGRTLPPMRRLSSSRVARPTTISRLHARLCPRDGVCPASTRYMPTSRS